MTESGNLTPQANGHDGNEAAAMPAVPPNRVIERMGGRHLIFRSNRGGRTPFMPRPYGLISSFRGPVWAFYGIGQIWLTHKRLRQIGGWIARTPRIRSGGVEHVLDSLEPDLARFIEFCNSGGIEGTLVLEPELLEFHWTFGSGLNKENEKGKSATELKKQFGRLADALLAARQNSG